MRRGPATDDALAALVMAEALSCAIRGDTGHDAVAAIRRFADDGDAVLAEAYQRCMGFEHLDRQTRRVAARLLSEARRTAADDSVPGVDGTVHG